MRIIDEKALAAFVLAFGIIEALVWPSASHALAPLLLPSLFFVVMFSMMPIARRLSFDFLRLPTSVLYLIVWQQFLLPAAVLAIGYAFGLSDQVICFMLLTTTAGSLFASPALVQMFDLDEQHAVQVVVLSTLVTPLSILVFFGIHNGSQVTIDLHLYLTRIAIFLGVPAIFLVLFRRLAITLSDEVNEKVSLVGRWGAIVSLIVFGFAMMDQVTYRLAEDPRQVWNYFLAATFLGAAIAVLTIGVMRWYGMRLALTAAVLSGFRNVGLSFGLLGDMSNGDLAVYVGVTQIPVFLAPFLLMFLSPRKPMDAAASNPDPDSDPESEPDFSASRVSQALRSPQTASGSVYQGPRYANEYAPSNGEVYAFFPSGVESNSYLGTVGSSVMTGATNAAVAARQEPGVDNWKDRGAALLERLDEQHDSAKRTANAIKREIDKDRHAGRYVALVLVLVVAGAAALWHTNKYFAPMLFSDPLIEQVAQAHTDGRNFAVHDLNINIRDLRNAHIARMEKAPDVVVLGASHWQEGDVSLIPYKNFYNSHVHRDYYEDMLAVTEMYVRHDKLPAEMIITIRDNLFTPVKDRTDFLWLPGIKYYREMAKRLGLQAHSELETLPVQTWRELLSLPLLYANAKREFLAPVKPHATDERNFDTLDTLLPGGSILWSAEHQAMFTQERSERESLAFAESKRNAPPQIDPKGVEAIEALLTFLTDKGVKVYLAHPPFNPIYFDALDGSPYKEGLTRIEELTQGFADKYGLQVIGSFDPKDLGCEARMYIDAEHSSSECLGKLLQQYIDIDDTVILRGSMSFAGLQK